MWHTLGPARIEARSPDIEDPVPGSHSADLDEPAEPEVPVHGLVRAGRVVVCSEAGVVDGHESGKSDAGYERAEEPG